MYDPEQMIQSGTHLGSYRVESLIGQGGMGHVYRAVDTRLGRSVAIKVLPPHLSSHQALRERFEREARAISGLSHPHICTLFDVGTHDGIDFLVMEHLEGETLADRLERGPLPLDQVIRYGREVAGALASAHRRGIVHRDLKPGNVMITASGAKLLDFGLAKAAAAVAAAPNEPDAPTEHHNRPLTAEGTLLGTFQYMAPEQVEGREADARTDMFAFGALLYEMVTGKRAFEGGSRASLIASILDRQPPPLSAIEPAAPAGLDRLIRACLAKNPDERLQSAQDAALQLSWIGEAGNGEGNARSPRRAGWIVAATACAVALLAIAAAALSFSRDARPERPVNLGLLPPLGYDMDPPVVSSRREVAFFADKGDERALFVRGLADANARQLTVSNGYGPFWSPDGGWIAWFDGERILKIAAGGGTPEAVVTSGPAHTGAWGGDGRIVYAHSSGVLHAVPASGGTPTPLTRLDSRRREVAHAWPVILPDDNGLLYLSAASLIEGHRIVHVPPKGGTPTEILTADALVGFSDPYLLYARDGGIYAVRFDVKSVRVTGEPRRVADEVQYDRADGTAFASVSADGLLVFRPRDREKRRMVWYDRDGRSSGVALEDENVTRPRLSPDGRRVLLTKFIGETGSRGVFSVDLARGTRTLLTPPPRIGFDPVWLPDGERFVFTSVDRSGSPGLFVQHDDPQSQPTPLWEGQKYGLEAVNVTRDGRHVLVRAFRPETHYDLWLVPLDGSTRVPLLTTPASETWGDVSPDNRWLAYISTATGEPELYVRPIAGGRSVRVSSSGAAITRWSRDGSELFFNTNDKTLMRARVLSTDPLELGPPERLFQFERTAHYSYELSVDGTMFLVNELADSTSDIRSFNVMFGWKDALER